MDAMRKKAIHDILEVCEQFDQCFVKCSSADCVTAYVDWPRTAALSRFSRNVILLYNSLTNEQQSKPIWNRIERISKEWKSLAGIRAVLTALVDRFFDNVPITLQVRLFHEHVKEETIGKNWMERSLHEKIERNPLYMGLTKTMPGRLMGLIGNVGAGKVESQAMLDRLKKFLSPSEIQKCRQKAKAAKESVDRAYLRAVRAKCLIWAAKHGDKFSQFLQFVYWLQNPDLQKAIELRSYASRDYETLTAGLLRKKRRPGNERTKAFRLRRASSRHD